jgi:4-hydroxyphenylpyruvate dioxygenase
VIRFEILKFHHVEFWCSDAVNTARRFTWGLGMHEVASSNLTSGNRHCACSVIQSNELVFVFTAPYCNSDEEREGSVFPHPAYEQDMAHAFVRKHGLAVRALGIRVSDAADAYEKSVASGAEGVVPPHTAVDEATGETLVMSEVKTVDDVVYRYVSGGFNGPFLPNMTVVDTPDLNFGITRLDHAVTNVPNLFAAVDHVMGFSGMHEFSEFTTDDVGTVDSGLNSMVTIMQQQYDMM